MSRNELNHSHVLQVLYPPMSETTKPVWFVYVIQTDRDALYTGITTDVTRRFQEHLAVFNRMPNPRGARFFRTQKPVRVVYEKQFETRSEATRQELLIKKMPRTLKLTLLGE